MTIREHLAKKTRLFLGAALACWAFTAGGAFLGTQDTAVFLIGFVGFTAAILAMIFLVKCPRCGAKLGQSGFAFIASRPGAGRPNFCPFCGVRLDERLEKNGI